MHTMPPRRQEKRGRGNGASSSSIVLSEFDPSHFTALEHSVLYDRLKENGLIVEKSISPRIDAETEIRAEFDKFGWGPILDITGDYFPELIWQFYANIEMKNEVGVSVIRTFVKGVRIELMTNFLAELLHVPNEGPFISYNPLDTVYSDPQYRFQFAADRLQYRRVQTGSRFSILPTFVPLIDRLILYFISSNIVPRKAGNNELRNIDTYIIDKMLNGLGNVPALPVASILLFHMREFARLISLKITKHHAPFAIIISRILAACGVDFTGETRLSTSPTHALTSAAMTGMYFICRQGVWYRNPDSRNLTRHIRDPLIPAPTIADQDREERVHEEEALDRTWSSHGAAPRASRTPKGTRGVYSSIFDCLDDFSSRMARLEHHAMTSTYSSEITAPPYDRSAIHDLEESPSASDDE